jgi:NhaP-type Na+/H+ or K+/H+ antiporter
MFDLVTGFAIVGAVLVLSALASPLVQRGPISFPIIFLGLGFAFGPHGLQLLAIEPHDRVLETVGTLTLALVLFLDAVKIQVDELGRHWVVPVLILGPATLLIVVLIAGASWLILGLAVVPALIVGAALASTDPVVLRDVVNDRRIPRSIRQILKLEAGLNDLVVLPIILILIAVANVEASGFSEWVALLARLLILGPAIGFVVGGIGSWSVGKVDATLGIRDEFQALFGIGLVLAAFSLATVAGGDGFLAAFAAGLAVPILNRHLCDCFLDYGEVTSEMAMLVAFLLFGIVLSTTLGSIDLVGTVVLVSALLHGTSATPLVSWYARKVARETLDEERESTAIALFDRTPFQIQRLDVQEVRRRRDAPNPPVIIDVRSRSSFAADPHRLPGTERVEPDRIRRWAGRRTGRETAR